MIYGFREKNKRCFITDTGECAHDKFGNLESPNGGGGGGTPNGNGGGTGGDNPIIFPNMKPYPNNVAMPVIPKHLALLDNILSIRVLRIIPITKNVFVMKI